MRNGNSTPRLLAVAMIAMAVLCLAACQEQPPTAESPVLPSPSPVLPTRSPVPPTQSPLPPTDAVVPPSPAVEEIETREREMPAAATLGADPTDTDVEKVVALAKSDLAQRLDVPDGEITVELVEAVQWPDAGLGCPQPGMVYAQMITPGYLVLLTVENRAYEYHTDRDRSAVPCTDLSLPHMVAPGDSPLPIFVEMVQSPLSPDSPARMPPKDGSPTGAFAFNPGDRLLLVQPSVQVLPTTEVLVGLTTAGVPGKPYVASELFQIPSSQTTPLSVITLDADTVTLAFADQVFELGPGQSRSFKQKGAGQLSLVELTTIVNHGRPAAIGSLPVDSASP